MLKKATSLLAAAAVAAGTLSVLPASADEPAMRDITTMELVREMGLGINLGNTFESCGSWLDGPNSTVTTYETGWGSTVITQKTIQGYADEGFGTLRIPVAWSNMIGDDYTINADYIARVKEVTEWALDADLYVIVNIHWDGGWWENFPTDKEETMYRYKRMWSQIAEAFKDYDDHLIFESLNEEGGWNSMDTDDSYALLNEVNQTFVDLIRASGGNNAKRHLLIAGYQTDVDKTCDSRYKMPEDPENRCAVSVHYYDPPLFTIVSKDQSWGKAQTTWGTESDINYLNQQMNKLKTTFVDNGIPVIIGEYGACAMENKTQEQIVNYNKTVAEAAYTRGMCPVLWDTYYDDGEYTSFDRVNGTIKNPDLKAAYAEILGEQVKESCTVTVDKDSYVVTYGDAAFNLGASTDSDGVIKYSSSNEDVASVDENGNVTIKKAGVATITASVDSTDKYLPATPVSVKINVNKAAKPPVDVDTEMSVDYSNETTDTVKLPDGWEWAKTYELKVGEAVEATAVYSDSSYDNRRVKITVTRLAEDVTVNSTADSTSSSENSSASSSSGTASTGSSSASASGSTSSSASKSADASPATGVGGSMAGAVLLIGAAVAVTKKKNP